MEQETGQKSQFKFQIKLENNVEKGFIIKKDGIIIYHLIY